MALLSTLIAPVHADQPALSPITNVHGEQPPLAAIPTPAEAAPLQGISVAKCTVVPKIDGSLDDACWKTATHTYGFYRYQGSSPVVQQTEAWLCADARRLYVAFHCQDSHPEQIRADETLRDGNLGNDDYVAIQIDSQNTKRSATQFQVSSRGTMAEALEGGTADNITWAGDWVAVVKRVPDGWNAEIAIPWALMRYPRNTHQMGILLTRKLARETSFECWPYMPRDLQSQPIQHLSEFTGLVPADWRPRPIFLPYVLGSVGQGYKARYGIDAKYPITTTLTGVGTINPDFQDVAQAVENINFSYDQRMYPDSRPFFAEGNDFMPYTDVFYPRDIGSIDEGIKIVGKQGLDRIAALAIHSHENDGRSDQVVSVTHDFGELSDVHFSAAQDHEGSKTSSLASKFEGELGWLAQRTQYQITANHEPTWAGGRRADARDYLGFSMHTPGGKPSFSFNYSDTGPRFTNNVGFLPEINVRGADWSIAQQNSFDTGKLWDYGIYLGGEHTDHHTGGFFHDEVHAGGWFDLQSGWGMYFNILQRRRDKFRDHVNEAAYYWNERSLYSQGAVDYSWGTQADQRYGFLSLNQGYAVSRMVTASLNYNRQYLGGQITTQTILTGTYRLTYERSIGLRMISVDHAANVFLSLAQKARRGSDIYLLIGDPNAPRTRGLVTLKVVTPF